MTSTRNQRRLLEGTVTGDHCAKTITVLVERTYRHPKYKKYLRRHERVHAHDEKGEAHRGDRVEIRSCRPLSRTKRWMLVRILERSTDVEMVDVTLEVADVLKRGPTASAATAAGVAEASVPKASVPKGGAA